MNNKEQSTVYHESDAPQLNSISQLGNNKTQFVMKQLCHLMKISQKFQARHTIQRIVTRIATAVRKLNVEVADLGATILNDIA